MMPGVSEPDEHPGPDYALDWQNLPEQIDLDLLLRCNGWDLDRFEDPSTELTADQRTSYLRARAELDARFGAIAKPALAQASALARKLGVKAVPTNSRMTDTAFARVSSLAGTAPYVRPDLTGIAQPQAERVQREIEMAEMTATMVGILQAIDDKQDSQAEAQRRSTWVNYAMILIMLVTLAATILVPVLLA